MVAVGQHHEAGDVVRVVLNATGKDGCAVELGGPLSGYGGRGGGDLKESEQTLIFLIRNLLRYPFFLVSATRAGFST